MSRQKIAFLSIEDYEHPWDKSARNALEEVPGFTSLIAKMNEIGFERMLRIQYTGSSLKVNQNNFPEIYNLLHEACEILAMDRRPELYFQGTSIYSDLPARANEVSGVSADTSTRKGN